MSCRCAALLSPSCLSILALSFDIFQPEQVRKEKKFYVVESNYILPIRAVFRQEADYVVSTLGSLEEYNSGNRELRSLFDSAISTMQERGVTFNSHYSEYTHVLSDCAPSVLKAETGSGVFKSIKRNGKIVLGYFETHAAPLIDTDYLLEPSKSQIIPKETAFVNYIANVTKVGSLLIERKKYDSLESLFKALDNGEIDGVFFYHSLYC